VTQARAAAILGSPVKLTPAPFYCSVTPTGQAKVHGVIFTNVTLAITTDGGAAAFAAATKTAKTLGAVRAVSGLGDRAWNGPTGLLVLAGSTYLQVGRSAIFDPARLGADAPFPVVRKFAELVLAALPSPVPSASPSASPEQSPGPLPTLPGGSIDLCQLLKQDSADAIMTVPVVLASSPDTCTITPTVPVTIDGVGYTKVVLTANSTGQRDTGAVAFGTKHGFGIGASADSSAGSDATLQAALQAELQRFVDAVLAALP
jgi:hypothetical protein